MIRLCQPEENESVLAIINDAAQAYKGVIPADRWHEPYFSREYLLEEMGKAVAFWGFEEAGELKGVMGLQEVRDVTLIRHAYVKTAFRNQGIGGKLLADLTTRTHKPLLVGTWAEAGWAIRFYKKHGFKLVTPDEKNRLLRLYWNVPDRQVETSVVLADSRWFAAGS